MKYILSLIIIFLIRGSCLAQFFPGVIESFNLVQYSDSLNELHCFENGDLFKVNPDVVHCLSLNDSILSVDSIILPKLSNLKHLHGNNLTDVSNLDFNKLFNEKLKLKMLSFSNNDIGNIGNIRNLVYNAEILWLSGNNFIFIDDSISNYFNKASYLNLDGCNLNNITFSKNSNNIVELQLGNNNLTEIPSTILNLKNLKYLNLTGNQINYIDSNFIKKLKNLKKLYIVDVPISEENLKELKKLKIEIFTTDEEIHMPKTN